MQERLRQITSGGEIYSRLAGRCSNVPEVVDGASARAGERCFPPTAAKLSPIAKIASSMTSVDVFVLEYGWRMHPAIFGPCGCRCHFSAVTEQPRRTSFRFSA